VANFDQKADNPLDDPPTAALNESSAMPQTLRRRRRSRRFRPDLDLHAGSAALERRLVLSVVPMAVHAPHHGVQALPRPRPAAQAKGSHKPSHRVGPSQEINKQYNQFYASFQLVEADYVRALNQQSSNTASVSTTLTAPYSSGSASMQVADAGVFGPEGVYPSPVTATALIGSVPVGTFTLTGSSGNLLAIDTTQSSSVSLTTGTTLSALVTTSTATSAQAIFPNYITTSTQQLAVNLVAYFNSLPIKLPRMYAPPHQPQRAGALQQYVYQLAAGAASTSLQQMLLAISLPQTPGADLRIYDAAVKAAVESSRLQMLSGVQQIFANRLPVVPISGSNTSNSSSTSSAGSASTTGGSGSTSTGTA
jgi:hypothetical protein